MFAYGFAKSARANIGKVDMIAVKRTADAILKLNETELRQYVKSGELMEIENGKD